MIVNENNAHSLRQHTGRHGNELLCCWWNGEFGNQRWSIPSKKILTASAAQDMRMHQRKRRGKYRKETQDCTESEEYLLEVAEVGDRLAGICWKGHIQSAVSSTCNQLVSSKPNNIKESREPTGNTDEEKPGCLSQPASIRRYFTLPFQ